ncbi:MAG: hypothetical protein O3A47_11810 [Chloroflexi bacterium]|nr:hypothetical protein [Chloroflexota bacterium]
MKIDSVTANNRKKAFEIRVADASYVLPYAVLGLRPDAKNRVAEVAPDAELGMEGFTYRLADGSEDTIHLDAVLEYNQDPDYLKGLMLHRMTLEARKAVEDSDLSKRELIRRLDTSASQFYRLLDPTNSTKSVGQMLALLHHLLGKDVDVVISQRAAPKRAAKRRRRGRGTAAV